MFAIPEMIDRIDQLDNATANMVRRAIEEVGTKKRRVSIPWDTGEVYAYPHSRGGISWGVNGGRDGFCIARGLEQ